MPSGGQTPSLIELSGPIGYSAFLKKAQNQATKNITSDMMNRMTPWQADADDQGVVASLAFVHDIGPPAEHDVKHADQPDQEGPRPRIMHRGDSAGPA